MGLIAVLAPSKTEQYMSTVNTALAATLAEMSEEEKRSLQI